MYERLKYLITLINGNFLHHFRMCRGTANRVSYISKHVHIYGNFKIDMKIYVQILPQHDTTVTFVYSGADKPNSSTHPPTIHANTSVPSKVRKNFLLYIRKKSHSLSPTIHNPKSHIPTLTLRSGSGATSNFQKPHTGVYDPHSHCHLHANPFAPTAILLFLPYTMKSAEGFLSRTLQLLHPSISQHEPFLPSAQCAHFLDPKIKS